MTKEMVYIESGIKTGIKWRMEIIKLVMQLVCIGIGISKCQLYNYTTKIGRYWCTSMSIESVVQFISTLRQ